MERKKVSKDQVKEKSEEIAYASAKGLVGSIPIVGPLAAEIMGTVIPNRRMERVERLLALFTAKVSGLDPEFVQEKVKDPDYADLLEQAVLSAAKNATEEKIRRISNILANSISDKTSTMVSTRCINVVDELDDLDIITLLQISETYNLHLDSLHKNEPEIHDTYNKEYWLLRHDEALTVKTGLNIFELETIRIHSNKHLIEEGLIEVDSQGDRSLTCFGLWLVSYIRDVERSLPEK